MKLLSYDRNGQARFAVQVGTDAIDVADASAAIFGTALPHTIGDYFDHLDEMQAKLYELVTRLEADTTSAAATRCSLDGVKLLPPIPRPPKIVCVARNYAEHAKEAGLELPTMPILFSRFSTTLIGNGAPVLVPAVSHQLDWEGELAVVIGKHTKGRRITKEEAMDYVFGYSIFNDVTVRDYQFRVTQYTAGKNFRASGPFGPVIVTKDEIPDPHDLNIVTTLNGKIEQQANTGTMIFDIPTLLVHIADFIDLEPGDVIPTGTPAGVGFKRNPPLFLKNGDTISVEIAGLGILSNPVKSE